MKCWKCKTIFIPEEYEIKGKRRITRCPQCNTKYDYDKNIIMRGQDFSKDRKYYREGRGQIRRIEKKVKMSKKERLRQRLATT